MSTPADRIRAAEADLRAVEPRLGPLIDRHGPARLARGRRRSHFEALARAIVFQQLAGNAARAIWDRFRGQVDRMDPNAVLALPEHAMRAAGLSGNKATSIRDLAAQCADGRLPLRRAARLEDAELISALTQVRGIGEWTAQMFLMFQLGRLDVWPAGDLGVRNGYGVLMGWTDPPTAREMPRLGERFAPHRSVAAWYCWRAVETTTPE